MEDNYEGGLALSVINRLGSKYKIKLNEQQLAAATHGDGPALVLAGPGSGKTTVITARTAFLVMEAGVDPESILTLTFNRAAKFEMENRFNRVFGTIVEKKMHFSTFHSFCNLVVRDYEKRQGKRLKRIEGNEEEESKRRIVRNIYQNITGKSINDDELENLVNEIGLVKNKMLRDFDDISFCTRNFEAIFKAYEEYKKSNYLMDFDDMLTYAYSILNKCPDILSYYRNKYRYFQIDEGQDLSRVQFEILKLFAGRGLNNFFIVADDDQSIYGFRGAEPEYIFEMEKQLPDCRLYRLENNYRSSKNIVEISSKFIKKNIRRYDKNHRTDNAEKHNPYIIRVKDEREQLDFIIKTVREYREKHPDKTIALLYRNNLSSVALADALEREGIEFGIRQNRLFFFNHWLVKDILAFLNFSLDPTDIDSFMRIFYKMNRYISRAMAEHAANSEVKDSVMDSILKYEDLKPYNRRILMDLKNEFNQLKKKTPSSALNYIKENFKYFDSVKDYCENTGLSFEYLYGLFGILGTIADGFETIPLFLERCRMLEMLLENAKPETRKGGVTLTTIHSSKGLEYDMVIMLDLNNSEIPGQRALNISVNNKDDSLVEEERRLFYVGMTRAREYLYLVYPDNRNKSYEPASIFVREVSACINSEALNEFGEGVIVIHKRFGRGVIAAVYERDDGRTLLEIDFEGVRRNLDFLTCMDNGLLTIEQ